MALAVVLAALPPVVGHAVLPAAREGTAVPRARLTPELRVPATSELVVLGNSKAGTDIDVPTLRAGLGEPDLEVTVLAIGSATLPVHYAILKNIVLEKAHPRAIVVYATRVELLTSDLTADRRERLLRPYLSADEPVIARKLYDHAPEGLEGLRERAVGARDGTLSVLAATVAGVVSGAPGRPALDAAFTTVFGQTWATRERANLSTVPAGGYPSESAIGEVLEDTFVLEVEALCAEAGVPLVYAVAPVAGAIREREERRLRGMELVLAQAAAHADAWIELPQPSEAPANWRDEEHMSPAMAVVTTRALARALLDRDVLAPAGAQAQVE